MISNVYITKSRSNNLAEISNFLNSINLINGVNLDHLVKLIISNVDQSGKLNQDILYKLIILLSINCDNHVANCFLNKLFVLSKVENTNGYEESILIKLRQEINSFHPDCVNDAVKSLLKQFNNEKNEDSFKFFIQNLISIYEWDVQNQHFMTKNVSLVLIERECFINMINQISINETTNYSLSIIELYNKILSCDDEDFQLVKLNLNDLIQIAHKLVGYFFDLTNNINDENVVIRNKSINELIALIKNILVHLSNNSDESNLFRNILIRTLIDKLFQTIINVQVISKNN
jgi:hypothetical protein